MTDNGVCVVTHPLSAAGENATRTLLDILAALGPVHLITADLPEDSTIWDDHDVELLTAKGAGDSTIVAAFRFIRNQIRMCRSIAAADADTVLFFGATAYLLPILFSRALGRTVLVEPRGNVPLTLRLHWQERMPDGLAGLLAGTVRALERAGFFAATRVVTYTPNMARQLGLDPDAADVYPHGARYVNVEAFSVEIPYDERDPVVGFLGRIDEEKGIRELVEVAHRLPDDITFRFIGDGPLLDWAKSNLEEEHAAGSVEFAGWVDHDDVPGELNDLQLLVMPSHPTEGLPTTILEAMACGTPVYATPVSGVPDVVKQNDTGFLMLETDSDNITTDLVEILDRADLDAISATARRHIEAEYSFEQAVSRYETLFRELDG